jgi:hypothetical protein
MKTNTRVFGSILTHGIDMECPEVRRGSWTRCHGHIEPLAPSEEIKEPGFPRDHDHALKDDAMRSVVSNIATQVLIASACKTRDIGGRWNVTFMAPKECAEMAAELWLESGEVVRAMYNN